MATGSGGPSVLVKILADLTNFKNVISSAGDHVGGVTSRMRSAFSGVLGGLNQTGVLGPLRSALDGIDQAVGKIAEHAKGIGHAFAGAGAAITGVGTGLTLLGSKDQEAHQQLQAALEASGHSYEEYASQV